MDVIGLVKMVFAGLAALVIHDVAGSAAKGTHQHPWPIHVE